MILKCEELNAFYKNKNKNSNVLENVTVKIEQGKLVCLAGPNGSGKSTLMTLLAGLEGKKNSSLQIKSAKTLPFIQGSCETDKIFINRLNRRETAKQIGFMGQSEHSAWETSVFETILTGRFAHSGTDYTESDYEIVKESAELLNISDLLDRSTFSLSGGEFQKVRIARTLAQKPAFMLLDEPCAGLDISYEPVLLSLLKKIAKQQNHGILISIHDLNIASRFADEIILLPKKSPPIQNTPELILTEKNLSAVYNAEFRIFNHPVFGCPQVCTL